MSQWLRDNIIFAVVTVVTALKHSVTAGAVLLYSGEATKTKHLHSWTTYGFFNPSNRTIMEQLGLSLLPILLFSFYTFARHRTIYPVEFHCKSYFCFHSQDHSPTVSTLKILSAVLIKYPPTSACYWELLRLLNFFVNIY